MADFPAEFELFRSQVRAEFKRVDGTFERIDDALVSVRKGLRANRRHMQRLERIMEGGLTLMALHVGNANHRFEDIEERLGRLEAK